MRCRSRVKEPSSVACTSRWARRFGVRSSARKSCAVSATASPFQAPRSPGGRAAWNGEALSETAHEFLADDRTPKRLSHLLVHATDDDSFTRLLHRMVLNFLRDGGRRTEIGRLMLRLRDVLSRSDEFVAEATDRWRLEKQPAAPSTAAPAVLVEAAAAERHVEVPRWSAQTRRRKAVADHDRPNHPVEEPGSLRPEPPVHPELLERRHTEGDATQPANSSAPADPANA